MSLFISNAHASAAGAAPAGGGMEMLIMLGIFGLVFYFLIYRPQAKRVKEHKALMSAMAKGDEVLTQGGLVGKIAKIADDRPAVGNVELCRRRTAAGAVANRVIDLVPKDHVPR